MKKIDKQKIEREIITLIRENIALNNNEEIQIVLEILISVKMSFLASFLSDLCQDKSFEALEDFQGLFREAEKHLFMGYTERLKEIKKTLDMSMN